MKELLDLFLVFAKMGSMMFGGGYAMLPLLQKEVVEKRGWVTEEEIADYYAVGQCTPGVIAVNAATFIGQKRQGAFGGIAATLGVIFVPLILITLLAGVIQRFSHIVVVQQAFAGVRVCVGVMVFNAVCKLWKNAVVDRKTLAIFLVVFAGAVFTDCSTVLFVLLAAIAGILLKSWQGRKS